MSYRHTEGYELFGEFLANAQHKWQQASEYDTFFPYQGGSMLVADYGCSGCDIEMHVDISGHDCALTFYQPDGKNLKKLGDREPDPDEDHE